MAQTSLIGEVVEWTCMRMDGLIIREVRRRGFVIAENTQSGAVGVILGTKLDPLCPADEQGMSRWLERSQWRLAYPVTQSAPTPSRTETSPDSP